ncbi:MAG: imidazolonepropionase [Flavobacteriales bacterium]|nr:imidazolonepropionase [Flavobacteriales bacterium]MBT6013513.1 imidazolonepropionase [Flavobacteriales bacterium]MBT7481579.1 imidazolonepropionase [Flavobacteriales bacterium]
MKTVIKNISELIQTESTPRKWVAGEEMKQLNTIKDAFIEIEDGLISSFGSMEDWNGISDWNSTEIIDAEGGMVFPSYCDSHTHLVFAASREGEFVDRINGLSYEEIANRGGGILNSAEKLQNATEDELYESSLKRLNNLIQMGTGAIEIKSGYGLNLDAEIKMLRVIKRLKENTEVTIKATFLGAHALPKEYKDNKEGYMDLVINEMLPKIAEEKLADYVDIFCEKRYFTVEDTCRLLEAANKLGIQAKTHVNQFNSIGGVEASVKLGALSVDHLEEMKEEDYEALKNSECMPTILPSCSFFLGIPYGPAKKMMESGLPVALATDYNPGSTPSGNMNFVASLGCIQLKMTPEQVINATTINTAYAMGLEKEMGSICVGKKANFFITKEIPSYSYLPYSFGENVIDKIILNGKIIA